jgi:HPt (histidine-containing phosphotransfer) domain-containing protein
VAFVCLVQVRGSGIHRVARQKSRPRRAALLSGAINGQKGSTRQVFRQDSGHVHREERDMSVTSTVVLDQSLVAEIRRIEQASGREGIFATCVRKLESNLAEFRVTYTTCVARGDTLGAMRAAHTLKGSCRQLGAQALGDLFAEMERYMKEGNYAQAERAFDGGAGLVADSLDALKRA